MHKLVKTETEVFGTIMQEPQGIPSSNTESSIFNNDYDYDEDD